MMKSILVACLLLLAAAVPARAHPGVGIVMDRQGNVFYTDLVHVWRIAPDGRRSIAVRDVHTHELDIDGAGNLFGDDSEYLGGDRWRHRVWRRAPDGRVTDIIPWRDGFFREYGFVRDRAGAMYWVACPERRCTIRRRTPDGRTTVVGPGVRFEHNINWIAAGPQGSVYVVDGDDLRRIDREGRISTVVRGLGSGMMGLFPDGQGGLYVAVWGSRSVVRVAADGRRTTVARTAAPWAPSGVTVAPSGDLWILEYSTSNEARVRRIARNGRVTVF
ncbi:MAG TPA: hypothetical protein VF006_00590 [Longimicrobium sp.]